MKTVCSTTITVFALLLCLFLFPQEVQAQEEIPEGLVYSVSDGQVTITDYTGSASELVIPSMIEGHLVTRIADSAFRDCTSLTNITLPTDISEIGSYAFDGCTNLNYNKFNDGLYLGNQNSSYVALIDGTDTSAEYELHTSTKVIAHRAFSSHYYLTKVTIPYGVITIGDYAFSNCTKLVEISIPDSVCKIGNSAFTYCTGLTQINIPANLSSIGNSAFYNCSGMTCSIAIPDSVTSIGSSAFSGCSGLTEITLPKNIGSISNSLFAGCKSLTDIDIPEGVTAIGPSAFSRCDNLRTITIPNSIKSIGESAFSQCANLQYEDYSNAYYLGNSNNPYLVLYDYSEWVSSFTTSCTVHPDTRIICDYAFAYANYLTTVTIAGSPSSFGNYAFNSCSNLATITFQGNAPSFKSNAFYRRTVKIYYPSGNATWTEDIMQNYNGTVTWIPDVETAIEKWNLCLNDSISMNFLITVNDKQVSNTSVEIITNEQTVTYPISDTLATENACQYKISVKLAATQMTEAVTVRIVTNGNTVTEKEYSVRQYADYIFDEANAYDERTIALVKEMLQYGAMAQIHFDHNTETLANEGITGAAKEEIPEDTEELSVCGAADDIYFYGASLVYRDKIAVRYYFSGDVSDITFTSNGIPYTPVAKDSMHYIEIADILPQDLDQQITLTATDAEGNTHSVIYSPMNYMVRMSKKGSDSLKALLKALYNYHLVAKIFCAAV